tara:strand:- start:20 stop:325 length:306 start_codon:yes stop_codon:yes gene_type:complete
MYKNMRDFDGIEGRVVYEIETGTSFLASSNDLFQQWLSDGNTPEPAETPEEIATREQQETNASAIAYLTETDWYLLRQLDGGVAMTAEMKAERAKRRLEVI